MLDHLHLIDNENARELGRKINAIEGVSTVRFFPPFKPRLIEKVGEDGLMYWILLKPNDVLEYPEMRQLVSKATWDNPEAHQDVVDKLTETINKYNETKVFDRTGGSDEFVY